MKNYNNKHLQEHLTASELTLGKDSINYDRASIQFYTETGKSPKRKAKDSNAIDIENDSFGLMLNCAVRYACGRQTYMPHAVIDFISPLIPYLTNRTLWCLDQDITTSLHSGDCGNPVIDTPRWIQFRDLVRRERIKRGEAPFIGWWESITNDTSNA